MQPIHMIMIYYWDKERKKKNAGMSWKQIWYKFKKRKETFIWSL